MQFKYKESYAIVKEERFGEKLITIQVKGNDKRELLTGIQMHLDEINNSYTNLQITQLFACNCEECKQSSAPYFFQETRINKALEKGKRTVECGSSLDEVDVRLLLGDYIPTEQLVPKSIHKIYNIGRIGDANFS